MHRHCSIGTCSGGLVDESPWLISWAHLMNLLAVTYLCPVLVSDVPVIRDQTVRRSGLEQNGFSCSVVPVLPVQVVHDGFAKFASVGSGLSEVCSQQNVGQAKVGYSVDKGAVKRSSGFTHVSSTVPSVETGLVGREACVQQRVVLFGIGVSHILGPTNEPGDGHLDL